MMDLGDVLIKRLDSLAAEIEKIEGQLLAPHFRQRAPQELVARLDARQLQLYQARCSAGNALLARIAWRLDRLEAARQPL